MRISKDKLNPNLEKEISRLFYQVVADLKKTEEVGLFLEDILSPAEKTAITKRLAIAYWLANRRSYENIRRNLKVSSATIATIDRLRKRGKGIQLALKMIEADKWATKWAERIRGIVGKTG
jgi:uncharacterized protein YerC